jgi:hypothetical protein
MTRRKPQLRLESFEIARKAVPRHDLGCAISIPQAKPKPPDTLPIILTTDAACTRSERHRGSLVKREQSLFYCTCSHISSTTSMLKPNSMRSLVYYFQSSYAKRKAPSRINRWLEGTRRKGMANVRFLGQDRGQGT